MNALVANAELLEVEADTDPLVFAPLRAAEHAAEGRKRSRQEQPTPAPASAAVT